MTDKLCIGLKAGRRDFSLRSLMLDCLLSTRGFYLPFNMRLGLRLEF